MNSPNIMAKNAVKAMTAIEAIMMSSNCMAPFVVAQNSKYWQLCIQNNIKQLPNMAKKYKFNKKELIVYLKAKKKKKYWQIEKEEEDIKSKYLITD